MKLELRPEILKQQKYSCNCCGRGCRSFLVPVEEGERKSIETLADWWSELRVPELFIEHRAAGEWGYGLVKRADGSCIFLDKDNLCLIHKRYGVKAKPVACQLYPLVLTGWEGNLRVGLRFDCPAVCDSQGRELGSYLGELKQLARQLGLVDERQIPAPPRLYGGQLPTVEKLDFINEAFLRIMGRSDRSLAERLLWLNEFMGHLRLVKWQAVDDNGFKELVLMFEKAVGTELARGKPDYKPITRRGRKMLGQIFFILSQPTTIITGQRESIIDKFKKRLQMLRQMDRIGQGTGVIPKIQENWPDGDLGVLEEDFGTWPAAAQEMIGRYLTCRIASMGYCGAAFYGYSMTEGLESLILGAVTIGWLMRIYAVRAGRKVLELADAREALMTIDGNLGYATALGTGPSRLRLRYIREHLGGLIEHYCG